jgi:hypothetical protein
MEGYYEVNGWYGNLFLSSVNLEIFKKVYTIYTKGKSMFPNAGPIVTWIKIVEVHRRGHMSIQFMMKGGNDGTESLTRNSCFSVMEIIHFLILNLSIEYILTKSWRNAMTWGI